MVTTTAEGFRPAAAKSGLAIVLRVPGHDGMPGSAPPHLVVADPDRLAQLLANLLENAMTFARTTVTVALAEDRCRRVAASSRSTTTAPASLPAICSGCSSASTGPTGGRTVRWDRGSAWRSWPNWPPAMGGTVRAESPVNDDGGSRFVVTLRQWQAAAPLPSRV